LPLDRATLARLRRKHEAGLLAVARTLSGYAKERATQHVDVGTYRNSITETSITNEGRTEVLWGISLVGAPYAPYLEFGFRPHWTPARYIGVWMQRHGVGVQKTARVVSGGRTVARRRYKTARAVAMGLYVGGPGSTLDYGPGGATGKLFGAGGKLQTKTWKTKGRESAYLKPGKVGFAIVRWTVDNHARQIGPEAFRRGWARA
jgi:hypothetical protein